MNIVPTTAINNIVPKLSKKSRLGIKYPASKIIGGSIYKKNVFGVNGESRSIWVPNNNIMPIKTPMTIRRHDSGNILFSFGDLWKPVIEKKIFLLELIIYFE